MRAIFLGLACFISTYGWSEENMTSLGHACNGEKCVEQLCNSERTYCVDSPYKQKDNEKTPIVRNVEQDLNFYLSLISNEETTNALNKTVQQIALSNGSKWEVDPNFAAAAKGWKGGDNVSINIPHSPGGMLYAKHVYNLQNESTHQGFPAMLAEVDPAQSQKITALDPSNLQICLNTQICLKTEEKSSWIFSIIKPESSVVIGLNTDLDSEELPLLLIVPMIRGETTHWIPFPVKLAPIEKK